MPTMAILSKLLVGIAHPALLHREILLVVLNHRGHSGYLINKQLDTPKYHKCADQITFQIFLEFVRVWAFEGL